MREWALVNEEVVLLTAVQQDLKAQIKQISLLVAFDGYVRYTLGFGLVRL